MSFLFVNKTSRLNNLKTRTATNAKISVFVIYVEAIIYLLLYNSHDSTFNTYSHHYLNKKRLWHRCFPPVNFAKFLKIPFLQNTSGRLLLYFMCLIGLSKFQILISLIWAFINWRKKTVIRVKWLDHGTHVTSFCDH